MPKSDNIISIFLHIQRANFGESKVKAVDVIIFYL